MPYRHPACGGRLLRVLFVRVGGVSAHAGWLEGLLRAQGERASTGGRGIVNRTNQALSRYAGGAGVVAASCAALCCAGAPIIVSVLAATGLSFLRTDAILIPVIGIALAVALWGFWLGRRQHGSAGPLALGVSGSAALVAGVVYLHGVPSKVGIGAGAIILLGATVWNARLRGACDTPVTLGRPAR